MHPSKLQVFHHTFKSIKCMWNTSNSLTWILSYIFITVQKNIYVYILCYFIHGVIATIFTIQILKLNHKLVLNDLH